MGPFGHLGIHLDWNGCLPVPLTELQRYRILKCAFYTKCRYVSSLYLFYVFFGYILLVFFFIYPLLFPRACGTFLYYEEWSTLCSDYKVICFSSPFLLGIDFSLFPLVGGQRLWRILLQRVAVVCGILCVCWRLEVFILKVFCFCFFVVIISIFSLGCIWPLGCFWKEGGVPTISFGGGTLSPFFRPSKFVLE